MRAWMPPEARRYAVRCARATGLHGEENHAEDHLRLRRAASICAVLVDRDVVEFPRELREQPGKDICVMGGGELAWPLIEAELTAARH